MIGAMVSNHDADTGDEAFARLIEYDPTDPNYDESEYSRLLRLYGLALV